MVASHRQVPTLRIRKNPAFDLSHAAPVQRAWVAILFVAGHHTALAADTLGHVEVKAILFAWTGITVWNERPRGARFHFKQRLGRSRAHRSISENVRLFSRTRPCE